jgi:hypothetical protein
MPRPAVLGSLCLLVVALLSPAARAADPAPLLTDTTFMVVRGDVERLDVERHALAFARQRLAKLQLDDNDLERLLTGEEGLLSDFELPEVDKFCALLRGRGVKEFFAVGMVHKAAPDADPEQVMFMAVPCDELTARQIMRDVFSETEKKAVIVNGFWVYGEDEQVLRLTAAEFAKPRPDLAAAIEAGRDKPLTAVLALNDATRAMIGKDLQESLGEAFPKELIESSRLATLYADLTSPTPVVATIRCADANAAVKLHEQLTTMCGALGLAEPKLVDAARAITPDVEGDAVRVTIDVPKVDRIVAALRPQIEEAIDGQFATDRETRLQEIGQAIDAYANAHDGAAPASLDALVRGEHLTREQLTVPARAGTPHASYVYVKPQKPLSDLKPGHVLAYERFAAFPPRGVYACVIGENREHEAKLVTTEDELKAMLGK